MLQAVSVLYILYAFGVYMYNIYIYFFVWVATLLYMCERELESYIHSGPEIQSVCFIIRICVWVMFELEHDSICIEAIVAAFMYLFTSCVCSSETFILLIEIYSFCLCVGVF